MTTATSKGRHVATMTGRHPSFEGPFGSIRRVDASVLPIMERLSIRLLVLAPLAVREPHWHANAHELGYCLSGEVLVTIAANHAQRESFVVGAGEMFFAPSGAMHSIENIGTEPAELVLAFSHARPEDFGMKAAFGSMSDAVLGNTYDLPAAAFAPFDRSAADSEILELESHSVVEGQARHVNAYKYSVEATPPQIDFPAGTAHTTKSALWPALRDIAMFSVRVTDEGMREPHWHPETAEMGYVAEGSARMTILDPDGSIDTYTIEKGDVYFIPPAYPHHIENIGTGTFHALIFFDKTAPGDVGYRSLINVFPRNVLAKSFGIAEAQLPLFPFTEIDPLLVPRTNPVEPVLTN
jgi:oxalate decarboxylase